MNYYNLMSIFYGGPLLIALHLIFIWWFKDEQGGTNERLRKAYMTLLWTDPSPANEQDLLSNEILCILHLIKSRNGLREL